MLLLIRQNRLNFQAPMKAKTGNPGNSKRQAISVHKSDASFLYWKKDFVVQQTLLASTKGYILGTLWASEYQLSIV